MVREKFVRAARNIRAEAHLRLWRYRPGRREIKFRTTYMRAIEKFAKFFGMSRHS